MAWIGNVGPDEGPSLGEQVRTAKVRGAHEKQA